MPADVVVLDGGLATELEARGYDLADERWSARLLVDDPDAIAAVHRAYVEAGADCVIGASYQATPDNVGEAALRLSVSLMRASGARLVAASIGPYGAARADGSEYTGDYDLDEADLAEWHVERLRILESEDPDWLACETIPSFPEARALAQLVRGLSWFSFQCRDGEHIADGTPIAECARYLDGVDHVRAIGVNCTAPQHIGNLVEELRTATRKPIVVYPNSGERYDAEHGWRGDATTWIEQAALWRDRGARLIGGCCRVGPDQIRALVSALSRAS